LGQEFVTNSQGISPEWTDEVVDLDGFPDPTICGETYAAGGRALYRNYFASSIWETVYLLPPGGIFFSVRAREEFPGVVLAGGRRGPGEGLVIRSSDFGDEWLEYYPPATVLDVDFLGEEAETIFVASGAVFRSWDGGLTWQQVFWPDLPNGDFISEVIIDPHRELVYIAGGPSWGGSPLFVSHNWGETWHRIPTYAWGVVVALDLNVNGVLYGANSQAGVFRFDPEVISGVGPGDEAPAPVVFHRNFPNPFNPTTTLEFSLLRADRVRLRLFDLRGHLLRTLVDNQFPVGRHGVTWDGRTEMGEELPSGVYIVRLEAGGRQLTQRVALVR
jgi:hypothetical protein